MLRLAVRFLISAMPTPRAVKKPDSFVSSKIFPPLSRFYSGCVMCNRVGCRCLSAQALPCREVPSQTSSLPEGSLFPAGRGMIPDWGSEQSPFVICTVAFTHTAQDTWLREIQDQICQPHQSHKSLCLLMRTLLLKKEHFITVPDCAA